MRIVVTGAASGLGRSLKSVLEGLGHTVVGIDELECDIRGHVPFSLRRAAAGDNINALINCAGVNENDWFEDVTREKFDRVMSVNAWGIVNMTQQFLPQLKVTKGVVINIVSNAAHMPMTSSLAYNASKAAALMITKQMAHELTPKYGITILSVSPNKLAGTGMSRQIESEVTRVRGWTKDFAEEYQRKALMHGVETPPDQVAEFIANLLSSGAYYYLSGCDVPFGK